MIGPSTSPWYSAKAAAAYLGVSRSEIYRMVQEGKLRERGFAGGAMRFHVEDLDRAVVGGQQRKRWAVKRAEREEAGRILGELTQAPGTATQRTQRGGGARKALPALALALCLCASLVRAAEWSAFSPEVDQLIAAIAEVETHNGKDERDGDNGKRGGHFQIGRLYLEDANAWAGSCFQHGEMRDPAKAEFIVRSYLDRWGAKYLVDMRLAPSLQVLARIHNGGPKGWKKRSTVRYWRKIKSVIRVQWSANWPLTTAH